MATAVSAPARTSSASGDVRGGFRPDIEGLRAVAVLLVLAYHAGLPLVSGGFVGVDVFFVISGFLITGLILSEVESTGRLRLGRFYARRIRRLLPATAVVLAATAILTILFLPPVRWSSVAGDIVASAAYLINWRLAEQSVDYLTAEASPSPVQHFWSLAVEEQFYVVWPLLIIALVWWARSRGLQGSVRRVLACGLALIAVPSLVWSIHLTGTSPGVAYLVSTTRIWELAIGALLALAATRLAVLPRRIAAVLCWAGLAAIAVAALTFDSSTPFPGSAALLPTLGAAAVIAAGIASTATTGGRLLGAAPMRFVGGLSYSLYLWHWPLLVAAAAAWGEPSPAVGTLVVAGSVIPAWLTHRLVERPIHHARSLAVHPGRAFAVGAVATAVALAAAFLTARAVPEYDVAADAPGAAVLGDDPANDPDGRAADEVEALTPGPLEVRDDNADVYEDGCHQDQENADLLSCAYGDVDSDRVVALVGDSHAAQWQPALDAAGDQQGWRVETYTKSSCGFFTADVATADDLPYTSCTEWNEALVEHLTGPDRPDIVVTTGSNSYRVLQDGAELSDAENDAAFAAALSTSWQSVIDADVPLAVIRNTPWLDRDVPDCVSANPDHLSACAAPQPDALERSGDEQEDAARHLELDLVDLNAAICPSDPCPAVIGNVIVWRDPHHLSATYARTLAPRVAEAIGPYLP
ncbi:acyltransferase family protein [Jiangella muralis]|uniref:acyltransferase family protein n=1 Tax=Jiangella muralis TaxID=702383 RepID=UPI00069FCDB6|nr:acyltransferase family protein [Jiangella muralis]